MPEKFESLGWDDLDKFKYFTIGPSIYFAIRFTLYPANLIKTRLQVQRGTGVYTGTFDAFKKILRYEGIRGLYKGFVVSSVSLAVGQVYISVYEIARQKLHTGYLSDSSRGFLAGGAASVVAQSLGVPIDIVSQKLMVQGHHFSNVTIDKRPVSQEIKNRTSSSVTERNQDQRSLTKNSNNSNTVIQNRHSSHRPFPIESPASAFPTNQKSSKTVHNPQFRSFYTNTKHDTKLKSATTIIKEIWKTYGLRGFYRGYLISILTFGPSSSIWWGSYAAYSNLLSKIVPTSTPPLLAQAVAGATAGFTSAVLINPVDVVRTRMQV